MKNLSILLGVSLLLSCTPTEAPLDKEAETKAAMGILEDFYSGFANADYETCTAFVTEDFFMYDVGNEYDLRQALASVQSYIDAGMKDFTFSFSLQNSDITKDQAVVYYTNTVKGLMGETPMEMNFLENAVFRMTEGGWKLRFLQSSEVVPETPEE